MVTILQANEHTMRAIIVMLCEQFTDNQRPVKHSFRLD